MFEFFLKSQKILGMNSRNLNFIRSCNSRSAKRLADDKIMSKRALGKGEIAVPKLIAKIASTEALDKFDWTTLPGGFALKPNRGFGGEGILVVYGKKKNREDAWVKADGSIVTIDDLKNHIRNIIDGSFSLSNTPDIAFFEERLQLLKLFKPYAYKGIPDIRVVVYNKVPVMAMLRLPTKDSGGKANLQQGAIGVGIDLASGVTTTAVQGKNKIIEYVPGTRLLLSGIKIPYWKDILQLAVRTQEISKLGFLGVDVAIDKERGPVILELNARPGLSIQIANLAGLQERLRRVRGITIKTLERGVRLGMDLFGGEIEEELEGISGRKIISTVEKIKLTGKNGVEVEVEAKIDTGADWSAIDTDLARTLGLAETIEAFDARSLPYDKLKDMTKEERWNVFKDVPQIVSTIPVRSAHGFTYRPMVEMTILIEGVSLVTKVSLINRSELKYPVIVGKRDLGRFLIDVKK